VISDHETQINPTNMHTNLNISSAIGVLTADEAPAITSGKAISEKSVSVARNLIRIRPTLWHATEMLQGFAVAFAVLYSFGAVALGVALLFYTFSR
jgi:hypothetical protein